MDRRRSLAVVMRRSVALTLLATSAASASVACHKQPPATGPTIAVRVTAPGQTGADVERTVAAPLERGCGGAPRVASMRSVSSDGSLELRVGFGPGVGREASFAAVQACVAAARGELPVDGGTPAINYAPGPVLARYVWSSDRVPLVEVERARDEVHTALAQVEGVGAIESCGGSRPRILVDVSPDALAGAGLTVPDVVASLAPYTEGMHGSELAPLVLAVRNGAPVRLVDVAKVYDDGVIAGCRAAADHGLVAEDVVRLHVGVDRTTATTAVETRMRELVKTLSPEISVRPLPVMRVLTVDLAPELDPRVLTALRDTVLKAVSSGVLVEVGASPDAGNPSRAARVLLEARDDATTARALAAVRGLPFVRSAGEPNAVVELQGADRDALDAAASEVGKRLETRGELVERLGLGELASIPRLDEAAATRLGVSLPDARVVLAAREGTTLPRSRGGTAVVVRAAAPLDRLYVKTAGAPVPLSAFVATESRRVPATYLHRGQFPVVTLRVHTTDLDALRGVCTAPAGIAVSVEPLAD